jgi:hypothetical protein
MALAPGVRLLFLGAAVLLVVHQLPGCARASDPDILTDFVVPQDLLADPSQLNGTFFTYTRLVSGNAGDPAKFTATKATAAEFPALLGQSVSFAALVFGAGTVNPPHIHPRYTHTRWFVRKCAHWYNNFNGDGQKLLTEAGKPTTSG